MRLRHLNLRVRDAAACRAFYEQHFGFTWAFDADGGHFLRGPDGFLLALVPVDDHQPLPPGFHIGFTVTDPEDVIALHRELGRAGEVGELMDERPGEDYVSFRCWDPDGTEVEIYWDGA
jgi:catechol 2,3-dioxygenase-like lactoylglutathione lyase family enzyme